MFVAIILGFLVILILYYVSTKHFGYWEKKKVPYVKPIPLMGNYAPYITQREYFGTVLQKLCNQMPNEKYFGTFFGTKPALVVQDPEIIKLVFTKDFYYFNSRELMDYTNREALTRNMFFCYGDTWKITRQNLTPIFTSAKLKNMFYLIEKCAFSMEDMLDRETCISQEIEARTIMIRYMMDCIVSTSFGIDANTQDKDFVNNPFNQMGNAVFGKSVYRGFKNVFRAIWPDLFYGLGLKIFPVEIEEFFHNLLIGVFESRQHKPSTRNDLVDFVLGFKKNQYLVGDSISNLKTGANDKSELEADDKFLVSQCVLFFSGGFETSASFSSLTIYELAKDPVSQKRAQEEVDEYLRKRNNKLDFDCITELPFLNACISESLRLYPIMGTIAREVTEDYTFPDGLQLERGMRVHLPVHHLHHDPRNFPEPEKYKPERFMPGAEDEIKPYTYFPFGEGPRTCLGMRFSKMQMMPGLITFLKKFNVELAEGTPSTLEFQSTTMVLQPTNNLRVKVTLRPGWESRRLARNSF